MKLIKKIGAFTLICSLITGTTFASSAETSYGTESTSNIQMVQAEIKPEIIIKYDSKSKGFKDEKGRRVYPILYNETLYLPVRGLCGIFEKAIEWDGSSKSIFIGKTFTDPAGITKGTSACAITLIEDVKFSGERVTADLRPDVLVMYNFTQKSYQDRLGKTLSPLVYENTTYLPIEMISQFMGKKINWDKETNSLDLGAGSPINLETVTGGGITGSGITGSAITASAIENMGEIFYREKEVYNDVSGKIVDLVKAKTKEEKVTLAKAISNDYLIIEKLSTMVKMEAIGDFTEEEKKIHKSLTDFSISLGLYALVIENIAHMAAQGEDYALLADTLLYYALESQELMDKVLLK